MLRVLYIINDSTLGGAVQSLLDMLKRKGDIIYPIAVIRASGVVEETLIQYNIAYYIVPFIRDQKRIGVNNEVERDYTFICDYKVAIKLKEIIEKEKIHLIHTNSSTSNVGAIASLIAGVPHIWHIRELMEEHFDSEFLDKELKMDLFRSTDRLISISECVKNAYKQKYGVDSVCIYNGIDAERFLLRDFSLQKNNYFLVAGEFSPSKGQLDAIKAVEELVNNKVDVHLYLVGADSRYKWLLKKYVRMHNLEANVHFFSFRKDLRKLREKCMYAIMPSKMEALGRVTIEAMLAGCIVIGADTGGTVEIIGENSERGYLYKQGDYSDLAKIMQYAMRHENDNNLIRERAQKYALKTYDIANYLKELEDVYNDVIQSEKNIAFVKKDEVLYKVKRRYREIKDIAAPVAKNNIRGFEKKCELLDITQRWLRIKLEDKELERALLWEGIHSIAIYGMGYIGCSLYDELIESNIEVKYVIDKTLRDEEGILKVLKIEEKLPPVDAVINTVLGDKEEVCDIIRRKGIGRCIDMHQILDWCEEIL